MLLAEAEREYGLSVLAFNHLLGIDLNTKLNMTEKMEDEISSPSDLSLSMAEALQNRPDLKALELIVQEKSLDAEISKRENYPSLQLYGEYGWWEDFFPPGRERWNAQLVVQFPILGGIFSKKDLAGYELRIAKLKKRELKKKILWEVRKAFANLEFRARELRLARERWEKTSPTILSDWIKRRREYLDTKYAYFLARLEFEQAVGQYR